ncbi:hypothetical protein KEH51_15360 [[Brevibacterium] frigoritolerans]|uniref:PA domain-containing protein n=1 Tax=Peribacillus frigoritolerans TaxID=450367 RepID=A0A941FP71_9BACI|nr:hypothetical protein [Peribacillus frigoritolerans]
MEPDVFRGCHIWGLGNKKDLKNVRDKIVLLERGTLTFQQKVSNAEKAGAKGVIVFNNTSRTFTGSLEKK